MDEQQFVGLLEALLQRTLGPLASRLLRELVCATSTDLSS
jgi:hypothetical protein